MPTTTFKGYEIQTTGTNVGTWGDVLNDDMISKADRNVGGIVEKALTNAPVVLSATESQYLILRLTGTLTDNVQVTTAAQGMTIVENVTSGSFAVTFTDGVGGVIVPQGARSLVITDTTNGARIASEFPSGTRMLFQQTTPPVGWTKESSATYNDAAIRIVTGAASTGGSVEFTTAFASKSVSGTVGNTTLTINQIPAHTHDSMPLGNNNNDNSSPPAASNGAATGATFSTTSAGGGQSHTHTFTGTAINLAVKYADTSIGTKD